MSEEVVTPEIKVSEIVKRIKGLIGSGNRVDIDINDPSVSDIRPYLKKARVRMELAEAGLVAHFPRPGSDGSLSFSVIGDVSNPDPDGGMVAKSDSGKNPTEGKVPTRVPVPKRHQHSYVPPKIARDMISVLSDEGSHIIQLVGPTQCGKTTLVDFLGREMGRKMFRVNCRGDMGSEAFFGEKTIEAIEIEDPKTGENTTLNVIKYCKGVIEMAMTEGLDEDGNEVGEPGLLYLDEFSSCPSHIAIGLNRLLESDDPRRTIVLDQDGGRLVRSHSRFRIMLASNTVGRGATDMGQAAYTAQLDAMDLSTLNRITACFRMGYDRKVEKHILAEKIGDDKVSHLILKFRDAIRDHIKAGELRTPFTTAHIVKIADLYRIYGDLVKAIYYASIEFLMPEERPIYNETAVAILGKDLLAQFLEKDIDYM